MVGGKSCRDDFAALDSLTWRRASVPAAHGGAAAEGEDLGGGGGLYLEGGLRGAAVTGTKRWLQEGFVPVAAQFRWPTAAPRRRASAAAEAEHFSWG